jgi:hypothetical protein
MESTRNIDLTNTAFAQNMYKRMPEILGEMKMKMNRETFTYASLPDIVILVTTLGNNRYSVGFIENPLPFQDLFEDEFDDSEQAAEFAREILQSELRPFTFFKRLVDLFIR